LACFNPVVIKHGPFGTKDLAYKNSRFPEKVKEASIYPEEWSELMCDLKAIEALTSSNLICRLSEDKKTFDITGYTKEGLEVKIFYDVVNKRIKSHYPDLRDI